MAFLGVNEDKRVWGDKAVEGDEYYNNQRVNMR
jgi:hypothetical protein